MALTKFINIVLGIWLMVAPDVLGYSEAAVDNGHIIGPIIVTFSTISLWEATDLVKRWNYPFAIWLLLAPWLLGYHGSIAMIMDTLAGAIVFALSAVKSPKKNNFGGGWSSLWKENPEHMNHLAD